MYKKVNLPCCHYNLVQFLNKNKDRMKMRTNNCQLIYPFLEIKQNDINFLYKRKYVGLQS